MRPEDLLLTLCARTLVDDSTASRILVILRAGIDWESFLQAAIDHSVLPLTWRTLSQHFGRSVPAAIAREASLRCAAIARRNLFVTAKLGEIVSRLSSDAVCALAYKGPICAIQTYGNLSRRQFGDLDILVDEADYGRARERLEAYGYQLTFDWGWECSFDDASHSLRVDLHRNVAPLRFPVTLNFAQLWERREYAPVLQRQIPTMCPADALVILSIELAKDSWGEAPVKLSKVCDIAELIRSQTSLDWRLAQSTSRNCGCRHVVEVSLGVTTRLFGPMPGMIPTDLDSCSRRTRLEDHIISRLFKAEEPTSNRPMSNNSFHFAIRERWRDKLYPILVDVNSRLKPNERDFALVRLPASLRCFYYLVRPVRLARDYLPWLYARRAYSVLENQRRKL